MTKQDIKQIIARIEKLEKAVFVPAGKKKIRGAGKKVEDLDFTLNERTFAKRYVAGKSGPKKFTLLLAYLVKGEVGKSIKLNIIKKCWNRMKAKNLLGQFNMFYSNEAKVRGWVDPGEYGMYCLAKEWRNAL